MAEQVVKVLVYGGANVNPINIIATNLREYSRGHYQIHGLNLWQQDNLKPNAENFITTQQIPWVEFNEIPKRKIIGILFKKILFQENLKFFKILFLFKFMALRKYIKQATAETYFIQRHQSYFRNFDLLNFHFISTLHAKLITTAPASCKIVASFWGSDLMRQSGADNYSTVYDAMNRADKITVTSYEMREILLSKFGRHLKNKVSITPFGQSNKVIDEALLRSSKYIQLGMDLLKKCDIDAEAYPYRFKVGYSGFESQNHLQIVKNSLGMGEELLSKSLFVIPMTYGATQEYVGRVSGFCTKHNINHCILQDYLSGDEALSLSFVCNIMFNLRDNDGFNNSMTETLLAGKILISGGWLPYSALRLAGVHFHEIWEMSQLTDTLLPILLNLENELLLAKGNPAKVKEVVSGEINGKKWVKVFQEVIEN